MGKNSLVMQETQVQSLGHGDPPREGNCYYSRIIAWRIPWTEEPVGYRQWGHKKSDMTEQLTL